MERDLRNFRGRVPYASELYGVHQPLLGWRSRLTKMRIVTRLAVRKQPARVRVTGPDDALAIMLPNKDALVVDGAGNARDPLGGEFTASVRLLPQPQSPMRFQTPGALDSLIVRSLQKDAGAARRRGFEDNDPRWNAFWRDALGTDALNKRFREILLELKDGGLGESADEVNDPLRSYVTRARSITGSPELAMAHIFDHEITVGEFLSRLVSDSSIDDVEFGAKVNVLLNQPAYQPTLTEIVSEAEPFALIPTADREAVLSPVGILHMFRQYFFELDNFLGPAVEHVWLAPGSRIELYEVSTRRTLTEEVTERSFESLVNSETNQTQEDELSEAVKSEDTSDTKLGSTISGGATVLVFHAEASGSMSVEETQKRAREDTHRTKRQQSAKLSSQIRNNFKSTFRSLTEATDTRSRRYVIENIAGQGSEPPKLRNYELRRKMRQVAIQTQDIGSQLCWQVFVDDPARELGVAQLVHLAAKSDLSKYEHVAPKAQPAKATDTMTILCPVPRPGRQSKLGPIAAAGFLGLMAGAVPGAAAGVAAFEVLNDLFGGDGDERETYGIKPAWIIRQEYKITLPPGYVIAPAADQDKGDDNRFTAEGAIPLRHVANGREVKCRMEIASATEGRILLVVYGGWLTPGEMMEFQFRVTIVPTAALIGAVDAENAAVAKDNEAKTAERKRVVQAEFISTVRERVTLASKILPRRADDLREEERTVIYRALIQRLMTDAWSQFVKKETAHLRSEFIRSIFDIDRMFYSVAPEWWQPRRRRSSQEIGAELPESISAFSAASAAAAVAVARKNEEVIAQSKLGVLGELDVIGWGGEGRADNYMITESSAPAKLGASLGWLLQLDADNLRNAFLNAPWVKAVIPIRPGREQAALAWLQQAKVEGDAGLDDAYAGPDLIRFSERPRAPGASGPLSVREVLAMIAEDIVKKHQKAMTPRSEVNPLGEEVAGVLTPERVFQFGFDHLKGGFNATASVEEPFDVFDQWVEVLPTDQIVAVEVEYDPKTGRML